MQLEKILARRPVGPARDVHHFHSVALRSLFKVNSGYVGMSLTRDQLDFSMGEIPATFGWRNLEAVTGQIADSPSQRTGFLAFLGVFASWRYFFVAG
jgi:hypothetical protein